MHIPADHKKALPGLDPPRPVGARSRRATTRPATRGSRAKINAAFAFGGLPLAVQTVECFTDVRIDHVMAIDFGGFKEVIDALGGVDLKVEQTITSIHKPYRKFTKGTMHMNGDEALDWIRQRKQFARRRLRPDAAPAGVPQGADGQGGEHRHADQPAKLNAFLKAVTDGGDRRQGLLAHRHGACSSATCAATT